MNLRMKKFYNTDPGQGFAPFGQKPFGRQTFVRCDPVLWSIVNWLIWEETSSAVLHLVGQVSFVDLSNNELSFDDLSYNELSLDDLSNNELSFNHLSFNTVSLPLIVFCQKWYKFDNIFCKFN